MLDNFKINDDSSRNMQEAMSLTRAGRLGEATAFLQRMLRGNPDADKSLVIDAEIAGAADAGSPDAGPNGVWGKLRGLLKRGNLPGRAVPAADDALPEAGQFIQRSFANHAGSRGYKLYIPSGYHGQPVPLVVMLHGCTQSPDDFAAGTKMNAAAEERNCLVVYPAQPASANAQKCWNWFNPGDQARERGEPSLIAGITRQIMKDYAVDAGRVYVAGLSAGGAAAAVMAATYPDLYAAVGVHSGLACGAARDLPSAMAAMRQGSAERTQANGKAIPTIVFHGDRDGTVSPVNGDQVIAQVAAADARTKVENGRAAGGLGYRRTVHLDTDGRPIHEQWLVHGGGHAWFGGSPAGSYTEPRGPDATREMLRFFLEHRRA